VSITRTLGSSSSLNLSRLAIASTMSFSRVPDGPIAPGSSPPWPGSSATVIRRVTLCGAGAGLGAGRNCAGGAGLTAAMAGMSVCCRASGSAGAAGSSGLPIGAAGSRDQSPFSIMAAIGSTGVTGYRSKIRRCL
jgi:hypothetical protein